MDRFRNSLTPNRHMIAAMKNISTPVGLPLEGAAPHPSTPEELSAWSESVQMPLRQYMLSGQSSSPPQGGPKAQFPFQHT